MQATDSIRTEAQLAGRATGAMFFFVFGAVWLEGWATTAEAGATAFAGIAVLALVLLAVAWRRYRRYAPALAQEQGTPERRRARRVFNIVNAGQWTAIFILALVLIHLGKGAWIIPMAIAVFGLLFLPLAHVFKNPPHYVTGLAMVAFAALYPLLASGGPTAPVGFLGAGLILWLSAAWALRA
jgi:uncharacterized membrane protein YecN with MAPEG domain